MSEKTTTDPRFEALFSCFTPLQLPLRVAKSAWVTHIPFAFWLVEAAAPRLLVELGTHLGSSFCAFCQQVAHEDMGTMCYAVDTWEGDSQAGSYDNHVHVELAGYVHAHYAAFAHLIRSNFDDAVPLFKDGSVDVLHIDGYHSYEAMLHDFETWLPKMSPRGVIVMHDINARIGGYGGLQVWAEISARFPTFAFDHGYGLGVVLTGADAPTPLRLLVEYGQDSAFTEKTRGYFMRLGAMQQKIMDLTLNEQEVRRALHEECQAHARRVQELELHCAQVAQQAAQQCEASLGAMENLRRQYEHSSSWQVTKPLRMLGRWWRRLRGTLPVKASACSTVHESSPSSSVSDSKTQDYS